MKSILSLVVLILMTPLIVTSKGLAETSEPDPKPAVATYLVLVTLDGLRWQELFTGADPLLLAHPVYTHRRPLMEQKYWRGDAMARREALLPFFWGTLANQGVIYGNRTLGNRANVTNKQWFSYPGYNEILTGAADESIVSNAKVLNENITILEWLNQQPGFSGRVAAFASWDVFPFIINDVRSGIPVNAGFQTADPPRDAREAWLNTLQQQTPSPWASVRLDVFTHHYALEHLKNEGPRVLYVAYGETDDFAHHGEYDQYLDAAHRTDGFLQDLWQQIQTDTRTRDKTAMVVTTDHGRGSGGQWTDHEIGIDGADHIWLAMIGPGVPALGEASKNEQLWQDQVAATVAQLLGFTPGLPNMGPSILAD